MNGRKLHVTPDARPARDRLSRRVAFISGGVGFINGAEICADNMLTAV